MKLQYVIPVGIFLICTIPFTKVTGETIQSIGESTNSVNVNVEKTTSANFSSNLPIIKINTNGKTIPNKPKLLANMQIIYNGIIGMETRGQSSRGFVKQPYDLETRNQDGSNNNVPLLDMPSESDWILYDPCLDINYQRNALTFHLSNKMGRWSPRTRYCEVFLNEKYKGLYLLIEKIKRDSNRVDIAKLKSTDNSGLELTGGYILKIDKGGDPGWVSSYLDNFFKSIRLQIS